MKSVIPHKKTRYNQSVNTKKANHLITPKLYTQLQYLRLMYSTCKKSLGKAVPANIIKKFNNYITYIVKNSSDSLPTLKLDLTPTIWNKEWADQVKEVWRITFNHIKVLKIKADNKRIEECVNKRARMIYENQTRMLNSLLNSTKIESWSIDYYT